MARRTYEMSPEHPVFTLSMLVNRFEKAGASADDCALARACIAALRREKRAGDKRVERARARPPDDLPAAAGEVFARLRDAAPDPVPLEPAERAQVGPLRRAGVPVQRRRSGYALPLGSPSNEVRQCS